MEAPRRRTITHNFALIPGLLGLITPCAFAQSDPTLIAKSAHLQVELRVPEEGLFAGSPVDVEFRLSDTRHSDPIEGFRGVTNAVTQASVTMPEMPGMPVQRPRIHTEGVPGDYGLELFFPHGGTYKIGLRIASPGDKPRYVEFRVPVKDAEARKTTPTRAPYALELLDLPAKPSADAPVRLKMAIRDNRTGQRVQRFDVAHTKLLHLILVSKDLRWFAHEHPTAQPEGTFVIDQKFPFGGDFIVFADAAPKDRGSQVVSKPLHLAGTPPSPSKALAPTGWTQSQGSIRATLDVPKPIPTGESLELTFLLQDRKTGKAVRDLRPYLGATGHLMIIHQDGKTFVHSHPVEGSAADTRPEGSVAFTARFPRPGLYKAWVQFQRGDELATIPFVFRVGGKS